MNWLVGVGDYVSRMQKDIFSIVRISLASSTSKVIINIAL
jgi:hypothetical protein